MRLALLAALAVVACGPPMTVSRATEVLPPETLIVLDNMPRNDGVMGECRELAGRRYVTLYVAEIRRRAAQKSPLQREWLELAIEHEAVEHEVHHALNTCSDADH